MSDFTRLSIADAGLAMRAGTLTSSALTAAYLERIEKLNPHTRAFVLMTAD